MNIKAPRCPEPCQDRGTAMCIQRTCNLYQEMDERRKAKKAYEKADRDYGGYMQETLRKVKNPHSFSYMGLARRTMSKAAR